MPQSVQYTPATGDDLVEPDQRLAHLVEVRREPRVEETVERALEGGVARMLRLGRVPHRTLPRAEVIAVRTFGLRLDERQQGGGDGRVANEAHHVERHRQLGRLPGRLDQVHGVDHVPFLPDDQGEERAGDGALGDLGPRGCGDDEQSETESDDERTEGGHRRSPNDLHDLQGAHVDHLTAFAAAPCCRTTLRQSDLPETDSPSYGVAEGFVRCRQARRFNQRFLGTTSVFGRRSFAVLNSEKLWLTKLTAPETCSRYWLSAGVRSASTSRTGRSCGTVSKWQ